MNLLNMLLSLNKKKSTNKPLTLTAEEAGATVLLNKTGTVDDSGIQYRLNEADGWTPYTTGETITLANEGDYVQFQNTNEILSLNVNNYFSFNLSKRVKASGNIQSMLNYIDNVPAYSFCRMFYGCSSLTEAPKLPATILADYCYNNIFSSCKGLTKGPELPATILANGCYNNMFFGCNGLTEVPKLPATILADYCYYQMFYNCTKLTKGPELPATTLANYCYQSMFQRCTNLNYVKVRFTAWSPSNATTNWFANARKQRNVC